MSEGIGIVAALPGELAPLVRGWRQLQATGTVRGWQGTVGDRTCVAVCAGMGGAAATRAFAALRRWMEPTLLVSVGWAGSLTPEFGVGSLCRPRSVVDERTGERFAAAGGDDALVTLDRVADAAEKRRLREAYGAVAVDMEAATLARLSLAAGYQFRCLKAVSDGVDAALPDLNPFVTETGQFAMAGFVRHVVPRPRHWGTLMRFGRDARLAAETLARALQDELGVAPV